MRKIQVVIISILFSMTNIQANSLFQSPSPYSFGPQGRTVSDLRDFAKPRQMFRILPNMPVVATDSSGNRVYYTPDGKMTLSVAKDGSMSFSLRGTTKNYNASGDLTSVTKTLTGSGLLQETRNADGEIIGYRELNGDGKVSRTYDKDKNLTATFVYTGQGSNLDYVQNEMTKGRTYYDEYGRTMKDVDADGYILRTYEYEDVAYVMLETDPTRKELTIIKKEGSSTGLLVSTRDYGYSNDAVNTETGELAMTFVHTTTYYDKEGKPLYVKNPDGKITMEYHYKQDDKGNKILDFVMDNLTRKKTFYNENGNRSYTVNEKGVVVARYYADYSVNYSENGAIVSVTQYDIDGTELYTTFKNITYNSDGTIDEIRDADDVVIKKYHYKTVNGVSVIDYVENFMDFEFNIKTYTWYDDDNRPMFVTSTEDRPGVSESSNMLKIYSWSADGNTLIYTFNTQTQHTQYYDMDKEVVYETLNEVVISKNLYDKGQLIGKWDAQKNELTIFVNERPWITLVLPKEPNQASIRSLIANAAAINAEIVANQNASGENESPILTHLLEIYGLI